ncbi:MAG: hypothetical protein JRN15_14780, partial [Nitrososphaerota archaeon]|nr:hypothetical protein [Nitrososphaerota archaeon]
VIAVYSNETPIPVISVSAYSDTSSPEPSNAIPTRSILLFIFGERSFSFRYPITVATVPIGRLMKKM